MEKIELTNGTIMVATELLDCYIVEPKIHGDHRGYFMESHNETALRKAGFDYHFVQGNESSTEHKNTIRGLHYQSEPYTQAKLVRCTRGIVDDVVVDVRFGSPTYKKWIMVRLSEENKRELLVPRGFLHGFITRSDNVIFNYVVDNDYSYEHDGGIIWNDPELAIDWKIAEGEEPILSDKDKKHPTLVKKGILFKY